MKIKYVSQAKKRVYEFFKKKIAYPEKGYKIYRFDKKKKFLFFSYMLGGRYTVFPKMEKLKR